MTPPPFTLTAEQATIVDHPGSAFVAACPGSGKTRVLVERARRLLADRTLRRAVAFLSFTTAAVSELEGRLRSERLLGASLFPHFIGTFDAFLWQFLIAPFGIPGCSARPRRVPDKDKLEVRPFPNARPLELECFDRATGTVIPEALTRNRFQGSNIKAYERVAREVRARLLASGQLDFSDVREIAMTRLSHDEGSAALANALGARFGELIVDEAQDCNPTDIGIISWFRQAGIAVKVICDPHQAIYEFRGGVTDELFALRDTFDPSEQFVMTGNFRSSAHITKGIVALRAPHLRETVDVALGDHRDDPSAVHILAYSGNSVPGTVGAKFGELTRALGLDAHDCPVLAATRLSCANALGQPTEGSVKANDLTCRLAIALSDYEFSFELGGRTAALERVHAAILEVEGHLDTLTYHQYVTHAGLEKMSWRPRVLQLIEALRYDPSRSSDADTWLEQARRVLAPLLPAGGKSINQRLRSNPDLSKVLSAPARSGHSARTIHSVKGMEFPAVCVVLSPRTAKGIVDHLSATDGSTGNEEARKLYVGASRAQRLLAIASPKSQAPRLQKLIEATGASVSLAAV